MSSTPETMPQTAQIPPGLDVKKQLMQLAPHRLAIENISAEIDGGRFPAKATIGQRFRIEADIFSDGHDALGSFARVCPADTSDWREIRMFFDDNDRWVGEVSFDQIGFWDLTIGAWRDLFATWRADTMKKLVAGQTVSLEIVEGRQLVEAAAQQSGRDELQSLLAALQDRSPSDLEQEETQIALLLSEQTLDIMQRFGVRTNLTIYPRTIRVWVDRELAGFSAWYELMPRSQTRDPERHGTFDDVIARLPYVRDLGFDVLYFPPIHPIGRTNRKGRNNSLVAQPGDPGSPYAIGSEVGGHDAVHPQLGTLSDFKRLVDAAAGQGMEIALDFAVQCSPDHPWIREHPEWFDWRPDGTIKFAENPPKKYEDIVNVHFYRDAIPGVWLALRDVVLFWIEQGVKIFRVDNPHTKPFPFWEWLISDIRARHPDAIFLAEAFTRPKVMARLAKLGFTQSYSYFTWRNTKAELEEYLGELTQGPNRQTMRPNFFVNTPDINPRFLQQSGRAGFRTRLVLAATLAGNYGVYNGFEICEARAVPGKEEYLDSEKYQIRVWDMDEPGHIKDDIALINRLRREHPALRAYESLRFYNAWNDEILYYGKSDPAASSFLLFHVNLDPHNAQETEFEVPLWEFGLKDTDAIEVEDLLRGNCFEWRRKLHRLRLDPEERPYAIWRLFPPEGSGR